MASADLATCNSSCQTTGLDSRTKSQIRLLVCFHGRISWQFESMVHFTRLTTTTNWARACRSRMMLYAFRCVWIMARLEWHPPTSIVLSTEWLHLHHVLYAGGTGAVITLTVPLCQANAAFLPDPPPTIYEATKIMLKSMWAYFCTARFNQRIPSISHPKPHTVNMRDDLCRLKVARLSGNREGPSRWTNDVDLCIIPRKIWPLLTPHSFLKILFK